MSKPGGDPSSGISLGDALRLPKRHPACRRREAQSGSCTERENLAGDAKGKAQAAPTARPKVLMRRRGADCLVVVRHRLCRPTANETLVSHCRLVGIELRRRVCFFVVMMENHDYSEIIGNTQAPYINGLAAGGALLSNYTA